MSTVVQDNFLIDNWKYLLAALVMHAAIGVLLTVTIHTTARTVVPAQLAIKAVVIDNTQKRLQREREQAEAERRAREEAEHQRELEAQAQRQAEERQEKDRQQAAAEKQRKAEEQRQTTARKQREAAEKKRVAAIKTKQADKQKAEREAREQAQREAELKRQLADEADRMAAVAGGAQAEYYAQIQAKIEKNWSRPPTARPGLSCELTVTQAPGGIVLSVKTGTCNGDEAVRESIEMAVNKSSPLPMPSDSRLFARTLALRFKPDE